MPTQPNTGQFLEGAFELAFGEISTDAASIVYSEPEVAIAYAVAVSPEAAIGGVPVNVTEVAIARALAVVPDIAGGVLSSEPATAVAYAIAIPPEIIPTGRAVMGTFGIEPSILADEFDTEAKIFADEWNIGVPA